MPEPSSNHLAAAGKFRFLTILRDGDHVAWPQGSGEPTSLTARLLSQALELPPFTVVLGMVTTETLNHPNARRLNYLCLNGAGGARVATDTSHNRVVPAHLSAMPYLIASRRLRVDVALVRVRPTSNRDVFSLGVMVD